MGARATLGIAYSDAGRTDAARKLLKSTLEQRISLFPPGHPTTLRSREAWGRFLLEHGDIDEAARQFQIVVQTAPGNTEFFVALARAGLARVALARGDMPRALEASRQATDAFAHVTGFRDVRMGPYVSRIRAAVLLLSGDALGAASLAEAALEDLRRFDVPTSSEIAAAEATLLAAHAARRARPAP